MTIASLIAFCFGLVYFISAIGIADFSTSLILRSSAVFLIGFILVLFRLHLIYRSKPHPSVSILALIMIGLTAFSLSNKPFIFYNWHIVFAAFIIYLSVISIFAVPKRRIITKLSKGFVAVSGCFLATICFFQFDSALLFEFSGVLLLIATILIVAGFFLKQKST